MQLTGKSLVVAMCIGQVGNLLPHVVVPAVMAQHLIPLWQLSASEAGLMASAFAIGYMLAVPALTALTDRMHARGILLAGSTVSGIATFAFGLFADGLTSAIVIWGLAGIGFAGAYMPGLKALTDRLGPGDISRSVMLYTASFSFGVGLSFLVAQLAADSLGLLMNLIVGIIGAFIGGFLISSLLGSHYAEGFNLPSIRVAILDAVILLAVFGGFQNRRVS